MAFDPATQRITGLEFDLEEITNFDFAAAVLGMGAEAAKDEARKGKESHLQELARQIAENMARMRNGNDSNEYAQPADGSGKLD